MKRVLIIINLFSICCLSWAFIGHVGITNTESIQEEEFVLEKVFFIHKKAEDLSVVCHAPVNEKLSSIQTQQGHPLVSITEMNCEALKENSQEWIQDEAAVWESESQLGALSEI